MITIVLADDHSIVRQGVQMLLESEKDFKIVGQATDGKEAVRLAEQVKPDVLVADLMMPGLNGIQVARKSAQVSPKTAVIVLSMYGNEAYIVEAFNAGVKGYVLKEATYDELVKAVRDAVAGRVYLSSSISRDSLETYRRKYTNGKNE